MLRKVILTTALLCASLFGTVHAGDEDGIQVLVPQTQRVLNENNKRCVWCSLEVLAHRAKIKRLHGLSEDYEGPANLAQVRWVLEDRKVRYKINPDGNTNTQAIYDFLVIPCQYEHRGVAVTLYIDHEHSHMLNVVHYDIKNRIVKVIDNCDPKLKVREWDWEDFHARWTGAAVIIYNNPDPFPRYRVVWY